VRWSPVSKNVNTEAEEATALEAVTRRQPMKSELTEKASYVLLTYRDSVSTEVICSYAL
jgi:hypothetical protein